MARVSLDDLASADSSKSKSSKASSPRSDHGAHAVGHGGSAAGGKASALASMDSKQKIKAGAAVAVIVVAGAFIVWNTGVLDSGPKIDPTAAPDATAEQIQQYNEAVQAEEAKQRSTGNSRLPPMPLGAN